MPRSTEKLVGMERISKVVRSVESTCEQDENRRQDPVHFHVKKGEILPKASEPQQCSGPSINGLARIGISEVV